MRRANPLHILYTLLIIVVTICGDEQVMDIHSKSPQMQSVFDILKHPLQIIRRMGSQPEVHEIVTEDGYILTAWRIRSKKIQQRGYPVLLQHGLMDLSFSWFINRKRDKCLPTILEDNGYDVWILNNRGTRYSNKTTKDVKPEDYFNFSFQEMARYDVTANVKYIQKITQKKLIHFIGHSQGTKQFFSKILEEPGFQDNIASFVGLGPVFFINNLHSLVVKEAIHLNLPEFLEKLKVKNFLVIQDDFNSKKGLKCLKYLFVPQSIFFVEFLGLIVGPSTGKHWNINIVPIICSHEPGGTSVRNLEHWQQNAQKKSVFYYDYKNPEINSKYYNSTQAPEYPIHNFKQWRLPTYLISGETDTLSTKEDLMLLLEKMPEDYHKFIQLNVIHDYSHLELIWADNAAEHVFLPILKFLDKH